MQFYDYVPFRDRAPLAFRNIRHAGLRSRSTVLDLRDLAPIESLRDAAGAFTARRLIRRADS